jgi:predicted anti-sigma-YlaC factor YlaD
MRKIMSLKPTCKEVHRLTSEGLDRELSAMERARVRMHLVVCKACRTFDGQMQLLRRAMRQLTPDTSDDEEQSSK